MELIIGSKAWSTWSMRPWLALKHTGVPFKETLITLRQEQATADAIAAAGSRTGLIPVLKDGGLTIHDSLAICEYLAERFPEARLWPADMAARALGRAAASEMHAGFQPLRRDLPMALNQSLAVEIAPEVETAIRRVVALWRELLARFGGPFLLGTDWSIADAFYTPVATRFRTYQVDLRVFGDDGAAQAYADRLLAQDAYLAWEAAA